MVNAKFPVTKGAPLMTIAFPENVPLTPVGSPLNVTDVMPLAVYVIGVIDAPKQND